MSGRVIRFPIADPLETALVAATELDREQLEQLTTALLEKEELDRDDMERLFGPRPTTALASGGP